MAGIANPLRMLLPRNVLPEAERLANRQAGQFMPNPIYHGTHDDFPGFGPGNPDSSQGINNFSTNDPHDAGFNYARTEAPDAQFRINRQVDELFPLAIGDIGVASSIFDSLPEATRRLYGNNVEEWVNNPLGIDDDLKTYITGQMGGGRVMPLALRPGKTLDLTNDPTQTFVGDLPDYADEAFAEAVRSRSEYLPKGRSSASDIEQIFNDVRYRSGRGGGENASARDFLKDLQQTPIMQMSEAFDDAGRQYNPSALIVEDTARDMGFPTTVIDPHLEFPGQYGGKEYESTRHYISEPERFRSPGANFDPKRRKETDFFAGAAPAGIIPTMSSPEQLETTATPSDVPDQGTVPNPLVSRPDLMTHTTSTQGPEMRDAQNFRLRPNARTPGQVQGRGTASSIPGGWRGSAYDYGRGLVRGETPFSDHLNPVWAALNEIPGKYLQGFATNQQGDWMNPLLLGADLVPGLGAAGRVGRTAAKQLVK